MRRTVLFVLLSCACARTADEASAPPGEPIPGLDAEQLARFAAGRALFDRDFLDSEGLGPLFNQRRCSSCHDLPTLGGSGSESVAKATRFEPPDRCDLLTSQGGDVLQQQVTPALAGLGLRAEPVPAAADVVISMPAPPLYGVGLIEAIADEAIFAGEDPGDRDGDGVRGRAMRLRDGRPGRFGRKLSFATARAFVEHALLHEMGLTTAAFPTELGHGGAPLPAGADPAADPEIDDVRVDLLADYVRLLAIPERERPAGPEVADSIRTGERHFHDAGCAACHTPTLRTQDGRAVALYSDLLLHDMGADLATICAPGAGPAEWRTAPLRGLRHRTSAFMHDGRAQSFRGAIEAHGGEAARARDRYLRLDPAAQALLLRFLASL